MERFSHELEKLRGTILRPVILFFAISLALLVLSPRDVSIGGLHFPALGIGTPTLATSIFLSAKSYLLPPGVLLVALGPVSIFMAPMMLAFLMALLITSPYLLYSVARYLGPALYARERKVLYTFLLPALGLFYLGCAFGYFLLIPKTFVILYSLAGPIDVTPFFSLDSFVSSVFLLTVSVGALFLLPVVMTLLTRLSLVPHERWTMHWRGAILAATIVCAVITPDGSGVTMVFLLVPLTLLYTIGVLLSR